MGSAGIKIFAQGLTEGIPVFSKPQLFELSFTGLERGLGCAAHSGLADFAIIIIFAPFNFIGEVVHVLRQTRVHIRLDPGHDEAHTFNLFKA